MTEQSTPLEKLQLNGRYYRCLIRYGYTTIEQIENYLSDKNGEYPKVCVNLQTDVR